MEGLGSLLEKNGKSEKFSELQNEIKAGTKEVGKGQNWLSSEEFLSNSS
jgi:hypothetical protein